ncbi:MAG: hypothetical protein II781_03180 [Clostridia bacterium]|nr:hypothetical protein [Clostridia bacterium]
MPSGVMCEEYRLSVPAKEESLLCVRLSTAGVMAQCRIDMNMMDEFKHAVSEACFALIHQRNTSERLSIRLRRYEDVLTVLCSLEPECRLVTDAPVPDASVCGTVLETMADKVEIDSSEDGIHSITLYAYCL